MEPQRRMFRRIIGAIVPILLGLWLISAGSAFTECTEPGKARWLIKTSMPEGAPLKPAKPVPLPDLLPLNNPPGVEKNDGRYQTTRIPPFANSLNVKEGDLLSTVGWLHLVAKEENDCDYHIQISNSPTDGNNCIIVEIPKDDEKFIASPEIRKLCGTAREFIRNRLLRGKEPTTGANVMQHPTYVRVTGQLFYDDAHIGDAPRGKKKMHAATLWELHPVIEIKFAPRPRP